MTRRDEFAVVANAIPFDNSTNGYVSDNVQDAIEELDNTVAVSASPGFTYGRSGNLPANTWLLCDTVPSNKAGRINFLTSSFIKKVFVSNENPDIIKVGIYTHDGNGVNLTLIGTVTTAAQRSNIFAVNISVPFGKQLAIKIESDTANSGKNMDFGLLLQGSI